MGDILFRGYRRLVGLSKIWWCIQYFRGNVFAKDVKGVELHAFVRRPPLNQHLRSSKVYFIPQHEKSSGKVDSKHPHVPWFSTQLTVVSTLVMVTEKQLLLAKTKNKVFLYIDRLIKHSNPQHINDQQNVKSKHKSPIQMFMMYKKQ